MLVKIQKEKLFFLKNQLIKLKHQGYNTSISEEKYLAYVFQYKQENQKT